MRAFFRRLFMKWNYRSADGKGRTLWQRICGTNVKDDTSLEVRQVPEKEREVSPVVKPKEVIYNPIKAKISSIVSFEHDLELRGKDFVIDSMEAYTTHIGSKEFKHTDYLLRNGDTRLRMRVSPNSEPKGYQVELYRYYDEMGWDQGFWDVLNHDSHEFEVNEDDHGNHLEEPRKYWRVNNAVDPYLAEKQILKDVDGDGKISDNEVVKESVNYWDYSRETDDPDTQTSFIEYIMVEMDNDTKYFHLYRGRKIENFQLSVI